MKYCKVLESGGILICILLWVLESIGFTPKYSQSVLKRGIICSLGMVDSRNEEENENQSKKKGQGT